MTHFETHFLKVKPIVLKLRRFYYIQLWTYDDWLQEGRIVLFKLMEEYPELESNDKNLFVYFKKKFSNYLKDVIRHQESQKRKFNRMPYEEVSDLGHCLALKGMILDDYVAYCDIITEVERHFGREVKEQLEKVMRGERFKGKKAFLKTLEPYFKDFK